MKIDFKKLILIIIVTFIIGSFFAPFVDMNIYKEIIRPKFSPPSIAFPIVWTILYILMSISFYLVLKSSNTDQKSSLKIYFFQLIINSTWTLIFFGFRNYLLGIIWIILLIVLVITMIVNFYQKNKLSGLLQIPYLIWLLIALYLNIGIYVLN